jgi:hypothetical protein
MSGYALIEYVNGEIAKGNDNFNEDTIVYGLGAENRRFYCDFPLIGGLFGYANHREFMDHAHTGKELFDYLGGLGCEFLLYSENTAERMEYAVEVVLPEDETFDEYFERIGWSGDYALYHLLGPGAPRMTIPETNPEEESEPE